MLFVVVAGIGALYLWGPSREDARWRWITPGTILAVVATAITSVLFSWYAGNFTDYNVTYGSLGALIGLLTWLWLTVTIIIFGAELNSEVEHQTARDSTTGPNCRWGNAALIWPIPLAAFGPRTGTTSMQFDQQGQSGLFPGTQ